MFLPESGGPQPRPPNPADQSASPAPAPSHPPKPPLPHPRNIWFQSLSDAVAKLFYGQSPQLSFLKASLYFGEWSLLVLFLGTPTTSFPNMEKRRMSEPDETVRVLGTGAFSPTSLEGACHPSRIKRKMLLRGKGTDRKVWIYVWTEETAYVCESLCVCMCVHQVCVCVPGVCV